MGPTDLDREAELSYAYIHAVTAQSKMCCEIRSRLADNAGLDAKITAWGDFPGIRKEVELNIQLKATRSAPRENDNYLTYDFPFKNPKKYNDLCEIEAYSVPRFLVVLFLPHDESQWLSVSDEALILRKCAYWVSLRGAPVTQNQTSQVVYIPKLQRFDPEGLTSLVHRLSSEDFPDYEGKIA